MRTAPPLVIVGGGPAGVAAAAGYRAAGGDGPVLMLTADDRPPYRRPPLSKELLRGEIDVADLAIEGPDWYAEHGVEVRCGVEVTALDPAASEVTTGDGRIAYRACLLATGSEPVRPSSPGVDLPGVHVLRSARDALALRAATAGGVRVTVIGSGFVGCEAAASLAMRGARVTVVTTESAPQAGRLGAAVGSRLLGWLTSLGVSWHPGRSMQAITSVAGVLRVTEDGGRGTDADVVLLATGAHPRIGLAEAAGLRMDDDAVVTDAAMRTSAEGVWCAGDAALALNAAAGRHLRAAHWGEALAQGAVAGRSMAGADATWDAVPGFWSTVGRRTLKQAAWGDGWDRTTIRDHGEGAFTAWYGREDLIVGVLTHDADADYTRGKDLIRAGASWPPPDG